MIRLPCRIGTDQRKDQPDLYGWHATLVKTGKNDIDFERTQRFQIWMDKDRPDGYEDDGEPIFFDLSKRSFLYGFVDIIADQHYTGYEPPTEGNFKD